MNKEDVSILCDPITKEDFILQQDILVTNSEKRYQIIDGIPVLLELSDIEKNMYALNLFKNKALVYDQYQHLSFDTFGIDETKLRNSLIDKLDIAPDTKILELSAGTGRDSELIFKRLDKRSHLYVQDISLDMLKVLKKKFGEDEVSITQSNACKLPYKSNTFDAIYSFAGVGMSTYSDTKQIMNEIIRVCKVGAKVVIGGLSMAPWLYDTEFGKILINHNNHYANRLDLSSLPIEARNVSLTWIMNGAGFCLEFQVGQGEPYADFDFDIPGERGGTLRTRYYGKLEGVSPEVKNLAYEARKKSNISMYEFLNRAIREAAERVLSED